MPLNRSAALALLLAAVATPAISQQPAFPYQDATLPIPARVDDLVSRMTLDEKAAQLVNNAPAIPRLGVPAYDYWSEALHGVARSGYATLFPQAIGMAATWDTPLMSRIADAISLEARAKYSEAIRHDIHSINYGLTLWSPNINIFRDPRWGRGQETYGEDPYLTARMGVAFVGGLQGPDPNHLRTVATPKHFAVHSGPESTRHRADIDPTPHDLEDTYLPAFRATITEAQAGSIMCAYNAVDGKPACASDLLLDRHLRQAWDFHGFVVSDCDAVGDFYEKNTHLYSPDKEHAAAEGIRSGTDLDCGSTYLALADAVRNKLIPESQVDVSLKRVLTARMRLGLLGPKDTHPDANLPFSIVGSPEHEAIALQAARESIVLLKNSGHTLPLAAGIRTLAVVGPNASSLSVIEGNYNAIARDPSFPVDAIRDEFSKSRVLYAQGSGWAEGVRIVAPRTLFHPSPSSTAEGLTAEYFPNLTQSGPPAATRIDRQIDFDWSGAAPVPAVPATGFSVRWSGTITAPAPGDIEFNLRFVHCGGCSNQDKYTVLLDGQPIVTYDDAPGSRAKAIPFMLHLPDTKAHVLRIDYSHSSPLFGGGVTLEWLPPAGVLRQQAVAAAQQAYAVVAFVGLSPELEGEEKPIHINGFSGGDRTDIALPATQQQLLEALAATGKPLVVVLLNGSAVAVDWAQQHAAAILEAWYPGEAGARAIAETLSGTNDPAGRLPVTVYASTSQLPAFDDYSMANRTYRYFKGQPLYRFGDGLSYTTFTYGPLKLSSNTLAAGQSLTVETDVKNTGTRAGDEVAELYLTPPASPLAPILTLQGFQRVHLTPGETRHLTFALAPRQLSQVDATGERLILPGTYTVSVGPTQPATPFDPHPNLSSAPAQATVSVTGTKTLPR
jgi:beta-glucosidase